MELLSMTAFHSIREKNIVFIGFMGSGKTTIGKLVAKKLMRDFIDIDQYIEKRLGMTIRQVFEIHGEAYFRKYERDTIVELMEQSRLKVISLGGGAFMQKEVRESCLKHAIVFFLDIPWEKWLERFDEIKDDRPILQQKNLAEIQQLYKQRYPIYSLNNSSITMKDESPETIADFIVTCLKDGWSQYDGKDEPIASFEPYIYTAVE